MNEFRLFSKLFITLKCIFFNFKDVFFGPNYSNSSKFHHFGDFKTFYFEKIDLDITIQ